MLNTQVAKDKTPNLHDLIGTWKGNLNGKNTEIALWVNTYIGNKYLEGIILWGDQCVAKISTKKANFGGIHADFYNQYDIEDFIKKNSYSMTSMPQYIKLRGNHCEKKKYPGYKSFYVSPTDNQKELIVRIYNPYFEFENFPNLVKVAASAQMKRYIDQFAEDAIGNKPSDQEMAVLNLQQDKILTAESTCREYWKLAKDALESRYIYEIETIIIPNQNIAEVNYWNNDGITSLQISNDNEANWNYLSASQRSLAPSNSDVECLRGKAVLTFFEMLDAGKFSKVPTKFIPEKNILKTTENFYLIDQYGVDHIEDKSSLLTMQRVYGVNGAFGPGIITRLGRWSTATQAFNVQATVINIQTGNLKKDTMQGFTWLRAELLDTLSKKYNTRVWQVQRKTDPNKKVCTLWQDEYNSQNCTEWLLPKNGGQVFLTNNLEVAKKIFDSISPNANKSTIDSIKQCDTGNEFCQFNGGLYLSALHEGNYWKMRAIDKLYEDSYKNYSGQLEEVLMMFVNIFGETASKAMKRKIEQDMSRMSVLPVVAETYMNKYQDYQKKYKNCLTKGSKKLNFHEMTPDIVQTNLLGMELSRIEGIELRGEYEINKEFIPMCMEICGVESPLSFVFDALDAKTKQANITALRRGVTQLMDSHSCNSPQIKQFEHNIIKMYEALRGRTTFQRSTI